MSRAGVYLPRQLPARAGRDRGPKGGGYRFLAEKAQLLIQSVDLRYSDYDN